MAPLRRSLAPAALCALAAGCGGALAAEAAPQPDPMTTATCPAGAASCGGEGDGAGQEDPASLLQARTAVGLSLAANATGWGGFSHVAREFFNKWGRKRSMLCPKKFRHYMETLIEIERRFKCTKSNFPDIGGLLVHGLPVGASEIKKWETVQYANMPDCGTEGRDTCSAYSLLRRDLAPVAYNFPNPDPNLSPRVYLILDPTKVTQLITGMSVIDSNTWSRNACSNNEAGVTGWAGDAMPACMKAAAPAPAQANDAFVYWPLSSGVKSPGDECPSGDVACMAVNSGGCISSAQWMSAAKCSKQVQESCFTFTPTSKSEAQQAFKDAGTQAPSQMDGKSQFYSVVAKDGCAACEKPYYCSLEPITGEFDPDEVPSGGWAVGVDGKQWAATFQVGDSAVGPLALNEGSSAAQTNQCKFRPGDWGAYINGIRSMYEALLGSAAGNGMTDFGPTLYAVPEFPFTSEYLESEVNLYIYPNEKSQTYKKQQEAFLDAILAVVVDPTTCEERYSFLDNYPAAANGKWSYATAKERCDKFIGADKAAKATEKQGIEDAIEAGKHVWELLQKQRPEQGIVALSAHFLPNNSPKTDSWEAALKGEVDPWSFLGEPWATPPQP